MENKKHLPMYGVGPIYVAVIIAVTVAAAAVGRTPFFERGIIEELLLGFYDCVDEVHGGEVAEKNVWQGIRGILQTGESVYSVVCKESGVINPFVYSRRNVWQSPEYPWT